MKNAKKTIEDGRAVLGIELGSTRIKAVLIGPDYEPIASGSHDWENRLENGVWTYRLADVQTGLREAYGALAADVLKKYGVPLRRLSAMGVSGMMHGYLAFGRDGNQLAPFRTWRNTITGRAAKELTGLLGFNIPQRWSAAHLYQAVLNGEEHTGKVAFLTTLSGYVHWKLTGEKAIGIGDASGMFPVDGESCRYNAHMAALFDERLKAHGLRYRLTEVLPRVLPAGAPAGTLTAEGARFLDPTGNLEPGVPLCPPEGDAGTGMTATNSVAPRTGNVSAGTSIFAMVVLEKPLAKVHPEIDMVATPAGRPAAMVHCNTCTSDLDAWVRVFGEFAKAAGTELSKSELYDLLYHRALEADADCGGLVNYNFYSGEPVVGVKNGCPMLVRRADADFTLANLMRAQLDSAMATLRLGMDILFGEERVKLDALTGHGGLFKTKGVGQRLMAAALGVPVAVMETAGEGGPWGMALLASFLTEKAEGETLEDYLRNRVFHAAAVERVEPDAADAAGFGKFLNRYTACLAAERTAADVLATKKK